MPTRAVYAGSFDPVTNGHLDLIRRGSVLFDEVIVGVGFNPNKKSYFFPLEQRVNLIAEASAGLENVSIITFTGLLVDACREHDANVILRGLRLLSDFDMEFRNGLANRDMSGLETVFLLTDPSTIFVSSSLVKEIANAGGDVSRYVPPGVTRAIAAKLGPE